MRTTPLKKESNVLVGDQQKKEIEQVKMQLSLERLKTEATIEKATKEAYDEGHREGKKERLEKALREAYGKGHRDGKKEGLEKGKPKGYAEGLAKGHRDGKKEGFDKGYAFAWKEGRKAMVGAIEDKMAHAAKYTDREKWRKEGSIPAWWIAALMISFDFNQTTPEIWGEIDGEDTVEEYGAI